MGDVVNDGRSEFVVGEYRAPFAEHVEDDQVSLYKVFGNLAG